MEYVKKQAFGGIRTCGKDEATHVLQTVSDYGEMIEIASMYRDLSRTAEKREKKTKEKYNTLQLENTKLRENNSSLRDQIAMLSQEIKRAKNLEREKEELAVRITDLEAEVEKEKNLNQNLLRISRERANADRKISPKKQHDGYLVLQSQEWRERRSDKNTIRRTWRSIIQTPFDASVDPVIAEKQIFDSLTGSVLKSLGCDKYVLPEDNGKLYNTEDDENVLYFWYYGADYRSGYWNVFIYTTKPLIVPPDRRARNYRGRNKRN